jgi:hypothetical protein
MTEDGRRNRLPHQSQIKQLREVGQAVSPVEVGDQPHLR